MKKLFAFSFGSKSIVLAIATALFSFAALAHAAEVQIFSNEQRQENSNSLILDNDDTGGNVSLQFGSALNEKVYWDNSATQFVFTDDLNVQGNIDVDGTITAGSGNVQLTDATGNIDGDKIANDTIDDDSIDFGMGADQVGADDVTMTDEFGNSSGTNVQDVVDDLDQAITDTAGSLAGSTGTTSNSYVLDTDNTGGNVTLQFGTSLNEQVYWNNASSRFEITDDVNIDGNVTLTGTVDGVDVSGLGSTVTTLGSTVTTLGTTVGTIDTNLTGHLNGGANKHDASEIDVEAAGNITTVADLGTNLAAIDTAFGNRTYTEDNYVTDGETITASLDALDVQVKDTADALAGDSLQSITISMSDLTVGADGSNNLADVYSDFDAANNHQYYLVKSQQASLQDINLKFKVQVPADFKDFTNANDVSFYYKNSTASALDSKIDILVEDDDGDDAYTAADGQGLNSASWTQYADEFDGGSFNPAAGEYIYVTVKGYAKTGAKSPYIGEVVINYKSKDVWAN